MVNDHHPPAPTRSTSQMNSLTELPINRYETQVRQLNVTGRTLATCSLSTLQKELSMSAADWKAFSSIIRRLKLLDQMHPDTAARIGTDHDHGRSKRSKRNQINASTKSLHRAAVGTTTTTTTIGTVSDTSLALTVRSAPLTKAGYGMITSKSMGSIHDQRNFEYFDTQHRLALGDHSGYPGKPLDSVLCPQHRQHLREPKRVPKQSSERNDVFSPERIQSHVDAMRYMTNNQQSSTKQRVGMPVQHRDQFLDDANKMLFDHQPQYVQSLKNGEEMVNKHSGMASQNMPAIPVQGGATYDPTMISGHFCALHHHQQQQQLTRQHNPKAVMHPFMIDTTSHSPGKFNRVPFYPETHQMTKRNEASVHCDLLAPQLTTPSDSSGTQPEIDALPSKDSASTSLAGEMVEEVFDQSPVIVDSGAYGHEECNCNYWYSLEAAASAGGTTYKKPMMIVPTPIARVTNTRDMDTYQADKLNSGSDTLSTTQSQLDISSNTSSEETFNLSS